MNVTKREYSNIHQWVRRTFVKTGVCEHCKEKKLTEWSNITNNYLRDRRDWQELCKSCHYQYDVEILGKISLKTIGSKGGSVKGIAKGFSLQTKEARVAAGRKGGKALGKRTKWVTYKGKRYSQIALAKKLGISRQRLSQMRKAKNNTYGIEF